MANTSLSTLSDSELISGFQDLVVEEREKLVLQLEHIAELDRRKLFFHYPSLRSYLVIEHGMEEWCAERKIRAARMLVKFPELKSKLDSGKLNLTLLELAQGCVHRERLTDSETAEIFEAISGMSCRAAMREIAARFPQTVELPSDRIRPLTAEFSEVRFVASEELLEKLEEIRGLLAHSHPNATMAELIDVLATEYRERHHPEEKAKRAQERETRKKQTEVVDSPTAPWVQSKERNEASSSRTPSIPMIHALVKRDGYRCSYKDSATQQRCSSEYGLQVDHILPWSHGGKTELSNLRFACRNHHKRISFLQFGESSKYTQAKTG